ncbi:LuxR C-terminal-related transcriptional regulator [Microbacterium sp. KSW4-16]|uniref:LuxR C-terminal-related transcriptional regulator n=1 Tax=Microbacterium TaxID=33882 RepID=UPI001039E2F4|nr:MULTISPECIES: LuxR C-terminal-related transcriptional regulator [Microbacterium]MCK8467565.1 LuxR C-terminal-related transcriptional regulator [Microbacterium aurugineum]TCJ22950.1 helix-turn-helix transcriptional regulator [Microbacterium sp. PI-1]
MSAFVAQGDGHVPRVSAHAISRPRLTATLETDTPLTLIRAASGSGKTTALVEWASATASRVVWITASPATAPSAALARALLRALPRTDVAHDLAEDGWPAVTSRLRHAEGPLVVVLDDAAPVDREGVFALCRAIATTPRTRLIVATNRPSPFDSEGLDLVIDTKVIAPSDLMFDTEEISRALGVDDDMAGEIREATAGFPALIRALALRGAGADAESLRAATTVIEDYLQDRLAECAFDTQTLEGLLRISVTDSVDLPLAVALTRDPDIAKALDQAETFGFGRWSDDGRDTFALTPLTRGMLRRELRRSFPGEVAHLRRLAAEGAIRRDMPLEGLRLALEDDDLRLAKHVTMSGWNRLLHRDRRAVAELLADVPVARLKQEPLVAMLLGMSLKPSRLRRQRGLQLLRMAVAAANSRRPTLSATERIFIWAAESASLRAIGRPEPAAQMAARALALFQETPESQWQQYARDVPLMCTHIGISLYYGGQLDEAIEVWERATALAAAHGSTNGFHGICLLAGVHALNGDLPEARHYFSLVRDGEWDPELLDSYQSTFYRIAGAMLAVEDGDLPAAKQHIRFFEPYRATSEHWTTMASVEAWIALHEGDAAGGLERLESFARLRGREASAAHVRHALSRPRVLLHLALGDVGTAKSIVQRDAGSDRFGTVVKRARLALIDGAAADVVRLLGQTRLRPSTARERAEALAVHSAALRRVSPAAAQPSSATLSAQLADRGLTTPLVLLGAEDFGAVRADLDPTGRATFPRRSALPSFESRPRLTPREQVVLRTLTSGAPLPTIAAELRVSQNTLKTQLRSIYRKLDAGNRSEALEQAARHGLLPD